MFVILLICIYALTITTSTCIFCSTFYAAQHQVSLAIKNQLHRPLILYSLSSDS
jgi:hypothetical protein